MEIPNYIKRALKCGSLPAIRDWRNVPLSKCTRAERNMKFIEGYFKIPEGDKVGQPLRLTLFQEVFFYCVFDSPTKIRRVIFSIARKNAKTALIAIIVILFIVGPEAIKNSRLASAAQTRDQASEVFNYASKIIEQCEELLGHAVVRPSAKKINGKLSKVEYKALSSDAKSNIGGSPLIAVIDEAGQIKGANDPLVEAIITGQLAYDNAMHFIISTQSATDGDWLSVQIDDAINNQPDDVICFLYAADEDCDLLDEDQWKFANPALDDFCSRDMLRNLLTEASRMPSLEASRRNLNLNQRINTDAPFVSKTTWQLCQGAADIPFGSKVNIGLDLSEVQDLTSMGMIAEVDSKWHWNPWFWLPNVGLREKSNQDRVPYVQWRDAGYLETTPGRSIDFSFPAAKLRWVAENYEIQIVAYDPYRFAIFKTALENEGFDFYEETANGFMARIGDKTVVFQKFRQGYLTMGPALMILERDLLDANLVHDNNPVMNMCAANATVTPDASGNKKLFKPKERHRRIDGMIALAMARGVASQEIIQTPKSFYDNPEFSLYA